MKELSIEQKAKAYDEIIKKANKMHNENCEACKACLEELVPELAEPDDEKIKHEIKVILANTDLSGFALEHTFADMIAWLEKQGEHSDANKEYWRGYKEGKQEILDKYVTLEKQCEQKSFARYKVGDTIYYDSFGRLVSFVIANIVEDGTDNPMYEDKDGNSIFQNDIVKQKPADKVEPKFKVGDWVVDEKGIVKQIEEFETYEEICYFTDRTSIPLKDLNSCRLWTIQDTKDGDVLSYRNGQWIFIYKEKIDDHTFSYHTLYSTIHQDLTINDAGFTLLSGVIIPATKEQRDLLFQKMQEAGYEWDAEKKKLKKTEQKPAWSEEDEIMFRKAIITIDNVRMNTDSSEYYQGICNWLISFKDRVGYESDCTTKQEWKQENIEELSDFENVMMHIGDSFFGQYAGLDPNDTNTIKEQATVLLGLVPKQEWSEEDENRVNRLIAYFEDKESFTAEDDIVYANWLKSLRPQHKQEWSQNDIEMIDWLIRSCEKEHEELCNDKYGHQDIVSDLKRDCRKKWDWLESLKNRVIPKNQ